MLVKTTKRTAIVLMSLVIKKVIAASVSPFIGKADKYLLVFLMLKLKALTTGALRTL